MAALRGPRHLSIICTRFSVAAGVMWAANEQGRASEEKGFRMSASNQARSYIDSFWKIFTLGVITPLVVLGICFGQDRERVKSREAPTTFNAEDLLDPRVLSGPGYTIEPNASLVEYRYVFRIRTPHGRIVAHGIP